ncbi:Pr6Pr family membrane protein [Oceanirhabdus sp. W0125-5]|uniref:Pr6Pr family membrane protein n=1 Tax=Oceanirhabdus sp. W0125-5 TaxID=2999116 RepID=UPI0022F30031|nr:Pr6Pr family membrane protein [Oceanirhabdus sp. W0125-5]WBW96759.1 Pr6Pr family membrane protein [Oceanirhabdus sp. W0125-5]
MKKEKSIVIFRSLFLLIGWFSVIGSITLKIMKWYSQGEGAIMGLLDSLSHYTIQTNILVLAWLTLAVIGNLRKGESKVVNTVYKSGITLYISFTFIIYALILQQLWAPTGIHRVLAVITHYVTPIVFILDWFFCEFIKDREEKQKLSNVIKWLIYPFCYAAYVVLIYGKFTGRYMYPFLHIPSIGYSGVLIRVLVLSVCYILMGLFIIKISRIIQGNIRSPFNSKNKSNEKTL